VSNGFQYDMNFGSNEIGLKVKDILNKCHIIKDVNILHLKLGGSCRLSYFLTSTP
jgi:hypothetical protein